MYNAMANSATMLNAIYNILKIYCIHLSRYCRMEIYFLLGVLPESIMQQLFCHCTSWLLQHHINNLLLAS